LALTSSKGGVGKTHLAASLSAALAKRDAHVLLIDADLGNGTISDRLGFSPKFNLSHFFLEEDTLEDLIEETPFGFSLIGGERGNFGLANLNDMQKVKFLRSFIGVGRNFDFVLLDLSSGINRQSIDFALLADKVIIVASPHDLISAYASVRACFSRFMQLEATLWKRIEGYYSRRLFSPLILMNFVLGSVFDDPDLFMKSEEKQCPVSMVSAYSKVALCVDAMAGIICSRSSFRGYYQEERLRYAIQILMEQKDRLKKGLTQKVMRISPIRNPFTTETIPLPAEREHTYEAPLPDSDAPSSQLP
jgi:MinD-like ATPase involved in chromosome partitioning or flagellar assembly